MFLNMVQIIDGRGVYECDGCCDGISGAVGYGMGNAVPPGDGTIGSGDQWGGFNYNLYAQNGTLKRVKVRRRGRKGRKSVKK